jgi:hypothetical protein
MRVFNIVKALLFFSLLIPIHADAQTFSVDSAIVTQVGNGHKLDAKMHYQLTPRVEEALTNGVPITFYQEIRLVKPLLWIGDYFDWYTTIWLEKRRFELRYHALTQQFVLTHLDNSYRQSFTSLASALSALGEEVSGFILPPEHLQETEDVQLTIQTGLDLNALPTPMRPGAMISRKWQLDSPAVTAQWQ